MRKPFTSDPVEVSARMRLIKGKNTKPELVLFEELSKAGIEFRPHVRIGRIEADAMLQEKLLIFVDSPFWHLRDDELLERLSPHWQSRLLKNRSRDRKYRRKLRAEGYSVIRFWADRLEAKNIINRVRRALANLNE